MAPGKSGIGEVGPWAPTRFMSGLAGGCNAAVAGGMAAIVAFLLDTMGPVVLPMSWLSTMTAAHQAGPAWGRSGYMHRPDSCLGQLGAVVMVNSW